MKGHEGTDWPWALSFFRPACPYLEAVLWVQSQHINLQRVMDTLNYGRCIFDILVHVCVCVYNSVCMRKRQRASLSICFYLQSPCGRPTRHGSELIGSSDISVDFLF